MKEREGTIYSMTLACALTREQYDAVRQLADSESMCMSTYLRRLCLRDLKEHGVQLPQTNSNLHCRQRSLKT